MKKLVVLSTLFFCSMLQCEHSEKQLQATRTVITYFNAMLSKNILNAHNLECILDHDEFINPISETEALSSDLAHTHWNALNKMVEANKNNLIDTDIIHQWAHEKLDALKDAQSVKAEIREETKPIYYAMNFVEIPAGTYINPLDGSTLEILDGIEIQDNLVTQYQWASVMYENTSTNAEGPDSEEISFGGKKIKMNPNALVNSISFNQIHDYIEKLNAQNSEYFYTLPSLHEFFAILQAFLGKDWFTKIDQQHAVTNNFLTINKKRVWDLCDSLWQWTRDQIHLNAKDTAHLIFGRYQDNASLANTLIRPVVLNESKNNYIGIRLIRCKKPQALRPTTFNKKQILWTKGAGNNSFLWDGVFKNYIMLDEHLAWLFKHYYDYPADIRHTLDCFMKQRYRPNVLKTTYDLRLDGSKVTNLIPLSSLIKLEHLHLDNNQISDISPLASLTNLKTLQLNHNQISNISPLVALTNLSRLDLENNQISDISPLIALTNLWELYLETIK